MGRLPGRLAALLLLPSLFACRGDDPPVSPAPAAPASRIVTLAPHLAELLYAVGAGDALVGVSAYTDYPEEAAALPVIGDAFGIDQERVSLLRPDLLLAWQSGTPAHVVDELRARGYRVETVETRGLDDVATALLLAGDLTGHPEEAAKAAADFRHGLASLRARYADRPGIRVFYQVSARPLYTVNGAHYVSELIDLCGGRNVFGDLDSLAPLVDVEAVLARDPETILASADAGERALRHWRRWQELAAVRHENFFLLPAGEIGRPTPRLLDAGRTLCELLEASRRNRQLSRGAR